MEKRQLPWRATVVDNDSSMARDQLAAERTFLSWIKLAMAVVGSCATVVGQPDWRASRRLAQGAAVYFMALAMALVAVSAVYVCRTQRLLAHERRPLSVFRPLFAQVVGCVAAASIIFALAVSHARQ
ncbi:hypothetical protein H4R18_005589 [Coemansia javaensis]|uniref:DUF202 domain-containing protein n=1 Tax=Coemansia javaensis TaxID=2761396 RepID=A0A9W8H844_9FUNG|nr:hypothetical protein H4R18_005589 [Coemansia javaensis]